MLILVSPSQADRYFRPLGPCAERYRDLPVDYRFWAGGKRIDIEHKEFPEDFLASWKDGRLKRQTLALYRADVGILLLNGYPHLVYAGDTAYVAYEPHTSYQAYRKSGFTLRQVMNRLLTLQLSGIPVVWVEGADEVCRTVLNLYKYFSKSRHISMVGKSHRGWEWGVPTGKEVTAEMLAGVPDLGSTRAEALLEKFPTIESLVQASEKEIMAANGVGPKTAKRVYGALRGQV